MKNHDLKYDIIIAGSGLGGLLCGFILAKEGMHVCILEKNLQAGGCLQTFRRKGVVFDTGVHYFGGMDPAQPLHRYWEYFGLTGSVEMERMNRDGFDIIGISDRDYPIAIGFDNFVEQLLPCFPSEKKNLEKYVSSLKEISAAFPLYNLELPKDHKEEKYRSQGAFDFFHSLTGSGILGSVLAGNNLLYAGNREHTPLYLPGLINHSFISSAWRTVGGSAQIAKKLAESILSLGGEIHLDEEVTEIGVKENIFKVLTKMGKCFLSEKFISGIHPATTLQMMDPAAFRRSYFIRIKNLQNTVSSFALYIVLNDRSFPYLDHNYYYHSTNDVWNDDKSKGWPSGYMLHTPAPASEDGFARNMIILSAMPFEKVKKWEHSRQGDRGREYSDFKDHCAASLLNLAEQRFPGLKSAISYMEASTPLTWRDHTGIPEGSLYGIERDYKDPLITTLLPSTKIPGFYFTGQNLNLHGMLGVTIGAVLTCGEIIGLEYLLKKIRNTRE
jgi:all-trans-retinol 13,14-reductase